MFNFKPAQKVYGKLPWVDSGLSDFKADFTIKQNCEIYLVLTHKLDREIHIPIDDAKILKKFLNEHL